MNGTIEISLQTAKELLPLLENQLAEAEQQVTAANARRDTLKTTIADLKAKLHGELLPLGKGEKIRQRKPKGYADGVITSVLRSLPDGQGLSMAEITKRTSLNHSSVFRTLKDPKRNKGRFVEFENQWRMKK